VGVRLRQAVLVAAELELVAARLEAELGLRDPFADPGVAEFGLRNAVYALGDAFIEIVSPTAGGTAAGRQLERLGGDGGYMAIFQLDDLTAARERVAAVGVRIVWQIDLPDMSGTHLHPADIGGTIVSLDRADPPESWRWGGPDWTGRAGSGAPGRLEGITVVVGDPPAVAERWGEVLGVAATDGERPAVEVDGGRVAFERSAESADGLVEIAVALPAERRDNRDTVEIGGVRFRLRELG
jgi:hypothetical protein